MSARLPIDRELARAIAGDAIGLFLEYRDQHGHGEDYARMAAVEEVAEGASTRLPHGVVAGPSFAARLSEVLVGEHVTVRVFAGPDADHRASCGSLVMRRDEAHALVDLLGPARP